MNEFVVRLGDHRWFGWDNKGPLATGYPCPTRFRDAARFVSIGDALATLAMAWEISPRKGWLNGRGRPRIVPDTPACREYMDGHSSLICGYPKGHTGFCGDGYYKSQEKVTP